MWVTVIMAYKVLYRKYRPNNFNEIIGQKSIIDTLKQSIKTGNFAHAYIFTGPRGTGKTSTARVLAKAINCENIIDGEPCGKCLSCMNSATSPDIIEIDAASNNGVDEIRELRNNVTISPTSSKYKIYIIDEVHMLTSGAFNALLKTLEEPPEHAIFILATTEVYKVPITILSRCQRYDFRKIKMTEMCNYLKDICKKEKINCTDDALEEIYLLSDGCLRDALSILDQTSKLTNKITLDIILENYNIVSNKSILKLIEYASNNEILPLLDQLDSFEETGMNSQKLIKKMIDCFNYLAIEIKLKKSDLWTFEKIYKLINELNNIYTDARVNDNSFAMIKLAFLSLVDTKTVKKDESEEDSDSKLVIVAGNLIDIRINNCFVSANKESLQALTKTWTALDKNKLADIDLSEYSPVAASENYAIFASHEDSLVDLFNIKSETIESMLKKNKIVTHVVAISQEKWEKEKNEYIKNRGTKKYEYIEEPQEKMNEMAAKKEINDIFDELPVEIS